jgi:hypothetical protein
MVCMSPVDVHTNPLVTSPNCSLQQTYKSLELRLPIEIYMRHTTLYYVSQLKSTGDTNPLLCFPTDTCRLQLGQVIKGFVCLL